MDHERFFKLISAFMEGDLDFEAMEEFHRALEEEFRRQFYNTFRRTVELCHQIEPEEVPESLHLVLIQRIRETTIVDVPPQAPRKPREAKKSPRKKKRR